MALLAAGAGVELLGAEAAAGFAFGTTLAAGAFDDTLLLSVCGVKTLIFFDLDLPPPFSAPTIKGPGLET